MILLTLLLCALCATLPGQDGRFEVRSADPAVAEEAVQRVRELAESGLERLRQRLPGTPTQSFSIFVHPDADSLPPEIKASHHPGSPGLALLGRNEIHVLLHESALQGVDGLRGTVDHELVHILLHQYAGRCGDRLPRWLHEGLAQLLAGDTYLGAREEDLLWRARVGQMLRLSEMRAGFPAREDRLKLAYAHSYSFVTFLERQLGLPVLLAAARNCDGELDFERALVRKTRKSLVAYEDEWKDYLINDSGAGFRVVLNNCFSLLVILAIPVLALATMRRLNRDRRIRGHMDAREQAEREATDVDGNADGDVDGDADGDAELHGP